MLKIDEIQPWMNWIMYPGVRKTLDRDGANLFVGNDSELQWHPEIFRLDLAAMAGKWSIVLCYDVDGWGEEYPPTTEGWNIGGVGNNMWGWYSALTTQSGYWQQTTSRRTYYYVTDIAANRSFQRSLMWYYNSSRLPGSRPVLYNHGFFFVRTDRLAVELPRLRHGDILGTNGQYLFHHEMVDHYNSGITERSIQMAVYKGFRALPCNISGSVHVNGMSSQFCHAFHPWKVMPLPLYRPATANYTSEAVDIYLRNISIEVDGVTLTVPELHWRRWANEPAGTDGRAADYSGTLPCADALLKCCAGRTVLTVPAVLESLTDDEVTYALPAPNGDSSILRDMAGGYHWAVKPLTADVGRYQKGGWTWAEVNLSPSDITIDDKVVTAVVKIWR